MSIEIVTAPEKGVTISLAGHKFFGGHRFVWTFDAIRADSVAEASLANSVFRESVRSEVNKRAVTPRVRNLVSSLLKKGLLTNSGTPVNAAEPPSILTTFISSLSDVLRSDRKVETPDSSAQ